MTHLGTLHATRTADTEVFYMAGRQLHALAQKLRAAGWPADTPASVVSNAGWPDARCTDHTVATLAEAATHHAGRPAVVTVGAGARALPAVAGSTGQPQVACDPSGKAPSLDRHHAGTDGPAA